MCTALQADRSFARAVRCLDGVRAVRDLTTWTAVQRAL